MNSTSTDIATIKLIVFGVIIVVGLVSIVIRKFSLRRFFVGKDASAADSLTASDDSQILTFYTAGHRLANGGRTTVNDTTATLFMTIPANESETAYVNAAALIYSVDLPFNTQTHMLGLAKQYGIDRIQFESFLKASGMEKVTLEGDFSDYFDLYAAPDQDVAVRQVMNPKSMAFVVDYCRSHFWEINDSQLYFVIQESDRGNTDVIAESQQFITQIRPALLPGDPGAAPVQHNVPYGSYGGPALACPICTKAMTMTDNWQLCPDNHGMLITGRALTQVHDQQLALPLLPGSSTEHGPLTCPNCHNQMDSTPYEGGNIQISACEHCPFRWLDTDSVNDLRTGKLISHA